MNTDEIKILQRINREAEQSPLNFSDIKDKVWEKIDRSEIIIEIDSFRYIAVACAVAAIVLLFFSVDILSTLQNSMAWQLSESVNFFL